MSKNEKQSHILAADIEHAKRDAHKLELAEKRRAELSLLLKTMYSEIQRAPGSQVVLKDHDNGVHATLTVEVPVKKKPRIDLKIDMTVWPYHTRAFPQEGSFVYEIVGKRPNEKDHSYGAPKVYHFSSLTLHNAYMQAVDLEENGETEEILDLLHSLMTQVHEHQNAQRRTSARKAGRVPAQRKD